MGLPTDGASTLCGEVRGLVGLVSKEDGEHGRKRDRLTTASTARKPSVERLWLWDMSAKSVNFICSQGLNHRQFRALLEEGKLCVWTRRIPHALVEGESVARIS